MEFRASNQSSPYTKTALKDILLVPSIIKNLLSVSKLTSDNPLTVEFCGNIYFIKDMKGQFYCRALLKRL